MRQVYGWLFITFTILLLPKVVLINPEGKQPYCTERQTLASEETIWSFTYGGNQEDHISEIRPTSDGGYIVSGSTSSFGAMMSDWWIMKLDSRGNIVWQKSIGGTSVDQTTAIFETQDGGFIVIGDDRSSDGYSDALIIR